MTLILKKLQYHNLDPVNLEIESSQCLGLAGPSGSGKTLLLRALADLDPYDGDILLDDKSVNDYKPNEWRKKVGLLPAESAWWFDSVGEHFNDYDKNLLHQLGFEDDAMSWEISRLSSGEKQRLGLLRLLANKPDVLLLDEPTANLDQQFVDKVENILHDYRERQKAALIWVSHDKRQLQRVADRIFEIKERALQEAPRA